MEEEEMQHLPQNKVLEGLSKGNLIMLQPLSTNSSVYIVPSGNYFSSLSSKDVSFCLVTWQVFFLFGNYSIYI